MRACALVQFARTVTFVSIRGQVAIAAIAAIAAIGGIGAATAGFAQATPHGGQFQINTFTPNSQQRPAVAFDAQGQLVAVWKSFGEIGDPDTSVQGQRYSAAGLAQGAQFQVNSSTADDQGEPADAEGQRVHEHRAGGDELAGGGPGLAEEDDG